MPKKILKNKEEKILEKAKNFARAEKMEWERLIEDPELIKEVRNLRARYSLPLPEDENPLQRNKDYFAWMLGSNPSLVKNKVGQWELSEHMQRFEQFSHDKKKLKAQFKIPEKFQYNLHNWICWGNICQLGFDMGVDGPPLPEPLRNNPKKKDWRPIWEWEKRHPDFSRKQIAEMMLIHEVTLKRHLEEIDKATEDQ